MEESQEILTEGELKKKAYSIGLRLKNSGLDSEVIYARLEKQGIPEELARRVANDVIIERKKQVVAQTAPLYNVALVRIVIGMIAALVSVFVFPGSIILPVGLIGGGIISALLAKKKMEE